MRSTGEVMGWDRNFARAFLKAQMGAGTILPEEGCVFVSIRDDDKTDAMAIASRGLIELGLTIAATRGTAGWLKANDIPCEIVNKIYEGGLTIVDRLKDGHIALVLNTTEGSQAVEDSREIRAVALNDKIPYFTTAAAAQAAVMAMQERASGAIDVRSLQG
jgi:carbamoyl-phosphate synthase large subunit